MLHSCAAVWALMVLCMEQELAVRYGFPVISDRSKFWIGIVELGGGWSPKDLDAYCAQLRINVPNTASINLPGSKSKYTGNPNSADGEYALDMQVIAGATDGLIGLYLVGTLPQLRANICMPYGPRLQVATPVVTIYVADVHVCHHIKRVL
jgi:hypothetical protein